MIIFSLLDSRAQPGLWEPKHDLSVCCGPNIKYVPYFCPKKLYKSAESGRPILGIFPPRLLVTRGKSGLCFTHWKNAARKCNEQKGSWRKDKGWLANTCGIPAQPCFAHSLGLAPPAAACIPWDRPMLSLCFTPSMADQTEDMPSST